MAAIIGTFFLLYASKGCIAKTIISTIYGISVIFLFTASSLYHAFKQNENEISFWRKMDHFAIFIMIAGTYTPICYVYLTGWWKWSIIIILWALVLGGFFFKFFYLNAPRYLYTAIYLIMGWVGIVPIKQFLMTMPKNVLFFIFFGGISYTTGAILYILKKPQIKPEFGFHEIFHFFILLGGFCHYIAVFISITMN